MRTLRRIDIQRHRHRIENFGNAVSQRASQRRCGDLTIEFVTAHAFGKTCRHSGSEVSRDQRILDLFDRGGVNGRTPKKRRQ